MMRATTALRYSTQDACDALQALGLAVKGGVIERIVPVAHEIHGCSDHDHRRRQQHSDAQQRADDDFDALIVPGFRVHRRPVTPLKIISKPSTTIRPAKT